MREFVGHQAAAILRGHRDGPGNRDVVGDGKGARPCLPRRIGRSRVVVQAHMAKIAAEPRLEIGPRGGVERSARHFQHAMH